MADLVITAANVIAGDNAQKLTGILGEAATAGKTAYVDPLTKTIKLADNNATDAVVRKPKGILLNGGAAGQPAVLQYGGDLVVGATLTPGAPYFLSDTPGGICAAADLASGEYVSLLGLAKSATVLAINIQSVDVATA